MRKLLGFFKAIDYGHFQMQIAFQQAENGLY